MAALDNKSNQMVFLISLWNMVSLDNNKSNQIVFLISLWNMVALNKSNQIVFFYFSMKYGSSK